MARFAGLLETLLAGNPEGATIDLDTFAEATAPLGLTHEEIGELLDALEQQGRKVGATETVDLRQELRAVLDAARALRGEHGRTPTLSELVERTGRSVVVVRRALQFGRIAGR